MQHSAHVLPGRSDGRGPVCSRCEGRASIVFFGGTRHAYIQSIVLTFYLSDLRGRAVQHVADALQVLLRRLCVLAANLLHICTPLRVLHLHK